MIKILAVVEDEQQFRTLVRIALRSDDRLQVEEEVATAEEAIEQARALKPDVIILDHLLDGSMTGMDAAPELKRVSPDSKIVLFTAFDLEVEAARSKEIDAFVRKQDVGMLLDTVRRVTGLRTT